MRIYIVDCDRNSRTELKTMIEDGGMGTVAGIASRWEEAYLELQEMCPDMILADLTLSAPKPLLTYRKSGRYCPRHRLLSFRMSMIWILSGWLMKKALSF